MSWYRSRSGSRRWSCVFMSMLMGVLSDVNRLGWVHPDGSCALDCLHNDVGDSFDYINPLLQGHCSRESQERGDDGEGE